MRWPGRRGETGNGDRISKRNGRRLLAGALGVAALLAAALAGAAENTPAPGTSAYPPMIGKAIRYRAKHEDTLIRLPRRFNVGYTELRAANPHVDPWLPGAGTEILVPTAHIVPEADRKGLVLNLGDQRLYYFKPDGRTVASFPVGIGMEGWSTPTGRTKVVRKQKRPTWYVPKSIRAERPYLPKVVPPGPDNPLGSHALYLGWQSYLVHGTNKPYGIGRRASHGCVRLYPEDIERLFGEIPVGTPVTVVDQPVKIAWVEGELMLEAHPTQTQADQVEAGDRMARESAPEVAYRLIYAARKKAGRLDWPLIRRTLKRRSGLPVSVLKPGDAAG
ncbi:MAG: L,D-transpeptidase family protein [Defluviicoccus sp.]|nr:L,D-transpeptidase family protein [Defluviicoccus sp.]MDE0276980.1 L,D-transpeptidase family protein [Defluviicoccus sp.]